MKKYCLREESKQILRNLRRQQKISEDCFLEIDECSSKKAMLEAFSNVFSLKRQDIEKIEFYLTDKMMGFETEESRYQNSKYYNLDKYDRLVMRELLKKNGVLIKSQEEDRELYRTFKFFENSCNYLINLNYIFKFQFTDYEIIYLLNPELLESARK